MTRRILIFGLLCAALMPPILAQAPLDYRFVDHGMDSGDVRNRSSVETVIFSETIEMPGASWLRLFFDRVGIASGDSGGGTWLRLTSLADGAVQVHSPHTLEQWQYSSAFFNGDTVKIELLQRPGEASSRVRVRELMVGEPSPVDESICGATDDRVLSSDPRTARVVPIGCTAWLLGDEEKCFLSAGHCANTSFAVLEVNVPLSNADGSLNHPPPQDQYPVDEASFQFDVGDGNDWAYFGVFPNGVSQRTVYESQGEQAYVLGTPPATASGQTMRVTGHGSTSGTQGTPLAWNLVQTTHTGGLTGVSPWLTYTVDTTGGDSGSAIVEESSGEVIGIHTDGGCTAGGGFNAGTLITNPGLQSALANPMGVCSDGPPPLRVLLSEPLPDPLPESGATIGITVIDRDDTPTAASSATLIYDAGGGDQQVAMSSTGVGTYEAELSLSCGTTVDFRIEVLSTGGTTVRHPFSAFNSANRRYTASVGAGWDRTFHDDFETDMGWAVVDSMGLTGGGWERGHGGGYGYRGDPPWDADASGQAFYTDPRGGNTDVDGGSTELTSPLLDASAPEAHVSYWRWWDDQLSGTFDDSMVVEISGDDGGSWTTLETVGPNVDGAWVYRQFRVADFVTPSNQVRLRFTASDFGDESTVEAAIDAVSVTNSATGLLCGIFADGFESGDVGAWSTSVP